VSLALGDEPVSFQGTSAAAPHVTGLLALLEAQGLQNGTDPDWRALKNRVLAGGSIPSSWMNW
jgi:subtilisin family serine protease